MPNAIELFLAEFHVLSTLKIWSLTFGTLSISNAQLLLTLGNSVVPNNKISMLKHFLANCILIFFIKKKL